MLSHQRENSSMNTPRTPEDYMSAANGLNANVRLLTANALHDAEQALREAATLRAELDGLREPVGAIESVIVYGKGADYVPADIARRLAVRNAELEARLAPEGWQTVVVEPTEKMLLAMSNALDPVIMGGFNHHRTRLSVAWNAAVSASPPLPTQPTTGAANG